MNDGKAPIAPGRTAHGRQIQLSPTAHRVERALLDQVLTAGTAATPAALVTTTGLAAATVAAALDELAAGDWLGRTADGTITALYPFSLLPTLEQVQIGPVVRYAMCAIDALGVAPMLDRTVTILAQCPLSAARLALTVEPTGITQQTPATIRVVYRQTAGPAHENRCGATHFFRTTSTARLWQSKMGHPADRLLTVDEAFARGRAIFADWYRAGRAGG